MLKRTLVFSSPVSLSLHRCQLVVAYKEPSAEAPVTVPIEDIGMVMVENQRVSITIPLLNYLAANGVQVVLADARVMPSALLQPFEGHSLQGEILQVQMACGEVLRKQLWKQVVEAKIRNQAALLHRIGADDQVLRPLYQNIRSGDADNREGAAARLYFPLLFGADFTRRREDDAGVNVLLNYGYAVLRAAVSHALVASGLYPGLGLFHHHRSNAFPLADDMMEPFRPFVDAAVYDLKQQNLLTLNKESKAALIQVLYADAVYDKVTRPLSVGLSLTTASLVRCFRQKEKTLSLPAL